MKKGAESTKTAIKFFKQFLVANNALEGYLAGLAAVKETPGLNFNAKRKVGARMNLYSAPFLGIKPKRAVSIGTIYTYSG